MSFSHPDLEVLGLDHNAGKRSRVGCTASLVVRSVWTSRRVRRTGTLRTVAALTARNEQVIASHVSAAVAHELPTWVPTWTLCT